MNLDRPLAGERIGACCAFPDGDGKVYDIGYCVHKSRDGRDRQGEPGVLRAAGKVRVYRPAGGFLPEIPYGNHV